MKTNPWLWLAAGIAVCCLICLPSVADTSITASDTGNSGPASVTTDFSGMHRHHLNGTTMQNRIPPEGMNWTPGDGQKPNWTHPKGMNWTPGDGQKPNRTPPDGRNRTPGEWLKPDWSACRNLTPDGTHSGKINGTPRHPAMAGNSSFPGTMLPGAAIHKVLAGLVQIAGS